MELIKGKVRVEWVELGEGMLGAYNPDDPDDVELLRFDVSRLEEGEWIDPGDASYCTLFPADASDELKMAGLRLLMNSVYEPCNSGHPIKKLCERLSYICIDWVEGSEWTMIGG